MRSIVHTNPGPGVQSRGAACTTRRTTERTFRPRLNLALRRANELVGVYDAKRSPLSRDYLGEPRFTRAAGQRPRSPGLDV